MCGLGYLRGSPRVPGGRVALEAWSLGGGGQAAA